MSQTLAIIDYGSGNLRSATKAVERAALEGGIDTKIFVTADPEIVRRADRILLPGVGAYADCRKGLGSIEGMEEALIEAVETAAKPFLGICVGMQLMAKRGLEKAVTHGFGWIPGDVVPIAPADPSLKIPQIGWNTLTVVQPHPLLDGIATGEEGLHAYFVHSYQLETDDPDTLVATTQYGGAITAMVARGNKVGTQFHPEKSQRLGLALLTNFLRWRP